MTSSDALGLFESFAHDTRKRSRDDRLRLRMRCPFVVSGVDAGTGVSTVVSDRVSDAPGGSLHWSGCDRLRRLGTLLTRLDTSGFERSTHQVLFHRAFEESCARVLYGDAYAIHRAAIDAKNNWTSGKSEVLISTPRRFGKTFAVSQFCACIALSCKQDIVIFSPGRRASRALLVTIHRFIVAAGCEDRLREYNQEQIRVQSMDAGEPSSSIRSFPSKVQTLKGVGGSIVVIEEAAYCEPQLIQEVVVPLLAMRNSVLLCISTLRESTNHYSKFFRMQARDGTPLFRCIQFSLVCDVCARSEHPERCRHKLHELPHWCSASRVETISNMLGDDPDMFMRETLGITADSTNRAFEEKQLQAMRSRPRILLRDTAVIYVAVDPAGGGNSQFAIVSIADTPQGDQAIIGIDAIRSQNPTAQYELLIKHLEALRKHACFRRSLIVLVPESNLGFEAQHIMLAVQRHPIEGCIPLVAGANGGIGFHTTKDTKAAMCKLLQELLQYDRLHVIRDVVSVGMTPESALDMLHTELGRFAIILEPPRSVFGAPRYTFSGKLGGQQDDLAVTLQIALLGARIFRTRPQYSHLRGMRTGTVSGHH